MLLTAENEWATARKIWERGRDGGRGIRGGKAAPSDMIKSIFMWRVWRESRQDTTCLTAKGGSKMEETGKISKVQFKEASRSACLLWLLPYNLSISITFCFPVSPFYSLWLSLPVIFPPSRSQKFFSFSFFLSAANQPALLDREMKINSHSPLEKTSFWMAIKINLGRGDAISGESWLFTEHLGARRVFENRDEALPNFLSCFLCEKWKEASTCDDSWGLQGQNPNGTNYTDEW